MRCVHCDCVLETLKERELKECYSCHYGLFNKPGRGKDE